MSSDSMNYGDYYRIYRDILTKSVDEKELETFLKEAPIKFFETRANDRNTIAFENLVRNYDKKYSKQFYEKAKNKIDDVTYLLSDRPEFADVAGDKVIPKPEFCFYTVEKRVERILNKAVGSRAPTYEKAATLIHSGLEELDDLVIYKPGVSIQGRYAVLCNNYKYNDYSSLTTMYGYIEVPCNVKYLPSVKGTHAELSLAKDLDDYLYLLSHPVFYNRDIAGLLYYNDLLRQNVEAVLSVLIEKYKQKDVIEILIRSRLQEYLAFV